MERIGARTFRLSPRAAKEQLMARHAGACRHVWNEAIAYINAHNGRHFSVEGLSEDEAGRLTAAMAEVRHRWKHPSFMGKENGLSKRFTKIRNGESGAWLRELNFETVRYSLKRLHDTYSRAFSNAKKKIIVAKPQKDGKPPRNPYGFPQFHEWRPDTSFTIPGGVRIEGGGIRLPTIGWVKIRPRKGDKICDLSGAIKQAVIKRENGKWYAVIFWQATVEEVAHEAEKSIGLDVGVSKPYTTSEGRSYDLPKRLRLYQRRLKRHQNAMNRKRDAALRQVGWDGKTETRKAAEIRLKKQHQARSDGDKTQFAGYRYSRRYDIAQKRAAKTSRKIKMGRFEFLHRLSKKLTDENIIICHEDLSVKNMTASAKGTAENPGKNVRAKTGLNREILDKGWYQFRQMLEYKAKWKGGITVPVDARHTSQQCAKCGHTAKENRPTQAKFKCVKCEHTDNADINAAKNILVKGLKELSPQVQRPVSAKDDRAGVQTRARKETNARRRSKFQAINMGKSSDIQSHGQKRE